MIVKQPWFGPKRHFGWGWTPVRWQGWAVTGAYLLVILAIVLELVPRAASPWAAVGATALLLVIARLTGGEPGGSWKL